MPISIAHGINPEIEQADGETGGDEERHRDMGIHEDIEIMQQEAALVFAEASSLAEPVFQQSQRTRPRSNFEEDAPGERSEVQPAKRSVAAGEQRAKDHPQNEDEGKARTSDARSAYLFIGERPRILLLSLAGNTAAVRPILDISWQVLRRGAESRCGRGLAA